MIQMRETPRTPAQWHAVFRASTEEIGKAISEQGDYKERLFSLSLLVQEAISQNRRSEIREKQIDAITLQTGEQVAVNPNNPHNVPVCMGFSKSCAGCAMESLCHPELEKKWLDKGIPICADDDICPECEVRGKCSHWSTSESMCSLCALRSSSMCGACERGST